MQEIPASDENWDEIRTAYMVARRGTVSGAAEALGVHHATVIRHVDALEARLGVRLFTRHARGYTPTEAGEDLMRIAHAAGQQFTQLSARLRGARQAVSGDLVITAIPDITDLLVPVLAGLLDEHPGLVVRLRSDTRLLRLEYGEAHLAIRAGARPTQPDNVVQPFCTLEHGLFATRAHVERYGHPETLADLARHRLVAADDPDTPVPGLRWLSANAPPEARVFRCTSPFAIEAAILAGAGAGMLAHWRAARHPELVELMPPLPEWQVPLWLVTHMDLHRTATVQAGLAALKRAAAGWPRTRPPEDATG